MGEIKFFKHLSLIKIASVFAEWDLRERRNREAAKGDVIAR
jgi:hypothetical protein